MYKPSQSRIFAQLSEDLLSPRRKRKAPETNAASKRSATCSSVEQKENVYPPRFSEPLPQKTHLCEDVPDLSESQESLVCTKTQEKNVDPEEGSSCELASFFHPASAPEMVVARTNEFNQIFDFCTGHLRDKQPGSLYICGFPGTGKTLTVTQHVLPQLDRWKAGCETKVKYKLVQVNCMKLSDPKAVFGTVLTSIRKKTPQSYAQATKKLQEILCKPGADMILLVLDEIDQLVSRDQSVLYQLFEWTAMPQSRLILIAIANAMDLINSTLPRLRTRNCEPAVVNFKPYTAVEIKSILEERVLRAGMKDTFQDKALELCSRKVAALSGDLRRALSVCRQAVELKEEQLKAGKAPSAQIGIGDMAEVLNSSFKTAATSVIAQLPLQAQILLWAAVTSPTTSAIPQKLLHQNYMSVCNRHHFKPVSVSEFQNILQTLALYGLVTEVKAVITLNIDKDDVLINLANSSLKQLLLGEQ